MFAEIQVKSQSKDKVVLVPSDAPYIKSGKTWVIILDANSMPIFKEVLVGLDNGEYTEIVEGIKAGDKVIVSGQPYVVEGRAVLVIK